MPNSIPVAGSLSESSRPPQAQTLRILSNIQKSQLLQATDLEQGFVWNDFLIPYSKEQLPKDENGSLDYINAFMENQKTILLETSRTFIQDILNSPPDERTPPHFQVQAISEVLEVGKSLGRGRYGEVNETKLRAGRRQADDSEIDDSRTDDDRSNIFALKRLRKPAPRERGRQPTSTVSDFETEICSLSKCDYRHIIHLRATFTDEANFGFIISEVAESTLQELLSDYISKNNIDQDHAIRKALCGAFGCLLGAISYLHAKQIKHRDIKPRNILVQNHRVLICDLGSAYDFEPLDRNESTEASRPPGTRKNKAPEVLKGMDSNERPWHNKKVDIFSLGCIFLEIYTILREQTLDQMAQFITQNETNEFEGEWTYTSWLDRANLWRERIRDSNGQGESLNNLIAGMVRLHSSLCRFVILIQKSSFARNKATGCLQQSCSKRSVPNTPNILENAARILDRQKNYVYRIIKRVRQVLPSLTVSTWDFRFPDQSHLGELDGGNQAQDFQNCQTTRNTIIS